MNQPVQLLYSSFEAFSQFGVTVNDEAGRFKFVNETFCQIVGYRREELLGKPYSFITHIDDREKNIKMDRLLLDDSIPFFQMKKRYVRKDGSICPVLLQVTMNKDEHNKFDSYLAIISDISDTETRDNKDETLGAPFYEAVNELPEVLQHMITSYELIGRYKQRHLRKSSHMAHIVHELRTPLNVIHGVSGRLAKMDANKTLGSYQDKIQLIADASRRMSGLVNEILDLEMLESGMFSIQVAPLDLVGLIKEVVAFLSPVADEHELALSFDFDGNEDYCVNGDYERLVSVFNNLISNAIKYTERGSVQVCLTKEKDAAKPRVKVAVNDSGIGIREEDLCAIFDEYQQVRQQLNKKVDSVGLGLPIAKKIIELHGGVIEVSSCVGEGSTFTVSLPC